MQLVFVFILVRLFTPRIDVPDACISVNVAVLDSSTLSILHTYCTISCFSSLLLSLSHYLRKPHTTLPSLISCHSLKFKGKLHSKIISSDMKDFFRRIQWWRSEVENRTGRRSNRRSKMAEKSWVTTPRGRHESLVPGVSSSRLRTDSDQSRIWCRARPWLGCDSLNELTWVSFVVHWHLTIFFLCFFLSFRECCLTRQWQSTECDARYMVQRKKFDVILRLLVDRYRRTKPPKPDASQTDSLFQRDFQNR